MKKINKLLTLITVASMALTMVAGAVKVTDFTDVKSTDWHYSAVQYVVDNNLFNGATSTTFEPNASMTRGMVVTVLGRLNDVDVSKYTGTAFKDVAENAYYAPYTKWAKEIGITSGTTVTTFAPSTNITREQMATFLYNYAKVNDCDMNKNLNKLSEFSDAGNVSAFAKEAMAWAVTHDIMKGDTTGKLNPKGNATRAEVATIFRNADEIFKTPMSDGNTDTPVVDNNNNGTEAGNNGNPDNDWVYVPPVANVYDMPTGQSAVDAQGGYYDYDLAKEIMIQINDLREDNSLEPLAFHPQIQEWASIRAEECSINYSHTRPNGTSYSTVGVGVNAENLAGPSLNNHNIDEISSYAVDAWYNSSGHKANMMNRGNKIGAVSCYIHGNYVYVLHLFSNSPMSVFETMI